MHSLPPPPQKKESTELFFGEDQFSTVPTIFVPLKIKETSDYFWREIFLTRQPV